MNMKELSEKTNEILKTALKAVDPYQLIRDQIVKKGNKLIFAHGFSVNLSDYDKIVILGIGKGAAPMTKAMEELLGKFLFAGNIIVKYGHAENLKVCKLYEAGHPVPDDNTIKYSGIALDHLKEMTEKDLVFVLLTGGGSALMEHLAADIKLSDLQSMSKQLLNCGASIHEINCIRKHISKIKGGQLARHVAPAHIITLALSDVVGDDLSVIASGPTTPDPSTYRQAMDIIEKYKIHNEIPERILNHIQKGIAGDISETPKPTDTVFSKVTNIVIGNNRLALLAAAKRARSYGFNTLILSSMIEGEAREIAWFFSAIIREIQSSDIPLKKPACILAGGEPTVSIKGSGKGGRNQELALAVAATEIHKPYVFLSCGSDGTDGPTDAAGAMVSDKTRHEALQMNLNLYDYLNKNDSYNFFKNTGELIITGPTRTNVMDIMIAIVPEQN